jgi:Raf kinase inhibitor-like YbhB/YbcL family protein
MQDYRRWLAVILVAGIAHACATPPAPEEATMPGFTLTSSSFEAGSSIPSRYTCDGEDVSPALAWEGVPDGAASLVLIVDDPDARGFAHWLVLDLTASASGSLPEGWSATPDAAQQGTNDFRRVGWGGPCPPSGSHRYVFTLSALDTPLGLSGAPRAAEVRSAMAGHVLDGATLEATYRRGG